MHAIKGGWAGQAFALATSKDPGGRKSRIRRSKEERKEMVESFVKKYQKSNNGNFPSLNLTHKEVGGSFYTVREIVREIIQENRVLAPPKVSSEEHGHSGFLEQHPLGFISVEPQIDFSAPDRIHVVTHIVPNKYQITSEESIFRSNEPFNEPYPLELEHEQITEGVSKAADKDEGFDRTSKNHHASNDYPNTSMEAASDCTEQLTQPKIHKSENEKIVNGVEVLEENLHSGKPLVTNDDHQDANDNTLLSSQKFNELGSQRLSNEQYPHKNDQTVDKTKEFGQRIHTESSVMEILDREKYGAHDVEASQVVKPYVNSNVVVETFPLRPVPTIIDNMDGESGKLHETAGILEDKAIQHDKRTFTQSPSVFVNEKDEEKLPDSTVELNGKYRDKKVKLNLQGTSPESSKRLSTSKPSVRDTVDIADLESKNSLADGTKASNYTESLISEDTTAVERKSSDQNNSGLPKGNSPTLDRINLETWEGASKKSTRLENNPLLALVKLFISSFVKFWAG